MGKPTAALVVIIYGIIAQYGLAGLMLIGMGLLYFDDLIKFISKTITVGFTFGIDVGIITGQIKDFFSLNKVKMS
ncbi:sulfate permease [Streptococcus constellatus]|nr:sulfate permease [Streptococcus constellatus]